MSFRVFGVARTQSWLRLWTKFTGDKIAGATGLLEQAFSAQRRVKRATGIEGPCLVRSLTLWTGACNGDAPRRAEARRQGRSPAPQSISEACAAQRRVKRATGIEGPCLVRSLTLWTMLRRRGVPVDLRVGFRKRAGKIEGHAWVEYSGTPINEEKDETLTFVPTATPASFDLWRRGGTDPFWL